MQTALLLTLAAAAYIAPIAATPSGCALNYDGEFQITVVKPHSRDTTCGKDGYLTLKLENGQLIDSKGRLGYIASNYQFQFDGPPQENADSVGGYSACQNGTLALKDSEIFYQCLSGDFYNLYDRSWAAQCSPIYIDLLPCNSGAAHGHSPQPSPSGSPVSQINDGQPQAPSATPRVPVSQIPDGQPQAPAHPTYIPTGRPVGQIPDGQPQAPTGAYKPSASLATGTHTEATTTSPPLTAGANTMSVRLVGASIVMTAIMAMFC